MSKHLCLNAIVRGESARILRMLNSVRDVISCFVILDTGSTDNTVALIEEWGRENNIPGIVALGTFVNFSQARNQALDAARSYHNHPDAPWFDYLLLCDADMALVVERPEVFNGLSGEAYEMVQKAGSYSYNNLRLLSITSKARYVGVTHEFLGAPSYGVIAGAHFIDHADGSNRSEKYTRDIRLFEQDLKTDPNNGRTWFYLGNTYRDMGNFAEAERCYRKKLTIPTWDEENWLTQVNLANCLEQQGLEDAYLKETLKAYQMRPCRAEPLHALAKHYREKGEQATSILFAEKGISIPRPDDKLFIEDWVYAWGCREEYSIVGFYDPSTRDKAFKITNSLALDPTIPEHVRYGARSNMVFYLKPLSSFCPSYSDQEIEFEAEDGFTAMNPSVTARPDGNLEVLVRTVNYKINEHGQYMIGPKSCWDAPIETENWLLQLDADLMTRGATKVWWIRPDPKFDKVIGLEDMRIFWVDGARQFIACVREQIESGMPQQFRGTLTSDSAWVDAKDAVALSDGSTCEKNWLPWDRNRYVYRLDRLDGPLVFMERVERSLAVDNISGGSQWIPFAGGMLSVVHEAIAHPSHGKRIYQHRFAFASEDFQDLKLSLPFVFRDVQIEFAAGLAKHRDGNLVISFGERDAKAWLAKVDASEVAAMLGIAV